jgi:hypothetical protein
MDLDHGMNYGHAYMMISKVSDKPTPFDAADV